MSKMNWEKERVAAGGETGGAKILTPPCQSETASKHLPPLALLGLPKTWWESH